LSTHTPTSRKEIRELVAARTGKTFASSSQLAAINREINLAFSQFSADAVEAFEASTVSADVLPVISLDAYGAGVRLPSSPAAPAIYNDRVLEFRSASDGLLSTLTSAWVPTTNKTWDGRYWLRIKVGDDVYELQTREWWVFEDTQVSPSVFRYYVSLVNPLPFSIPAGSVQTGVEIFQKYVILPADFVAMGRSFYTQDVRRNEVLLVSPDTHRHLYQSGSAPLQSGEPHSIMRGPKIALETPRFVPSTSVGSDNTWIGPFPRGTFDFCYTFVWGTRTGRVLGEAPRGVLDPFYESAPSALVTREHVVSDAPKSIIITAENVDARLGFDHGTLTGSTFRGRSGLRIRIYVRVRDVITSSGSIYNNVGTSDVFYLLTEIEPTDTVGTTTASYTWTGEAIPDFERPLFASPGYHGFELYPAPNRALSLVGDARRVPASLEDDYAVIPMHRDGIHALLNLICGAVKQNDGDMQMAEVYRGRYQAFIEEFRARHGQPGGVIDPATILTAGRGVIQTIERTPIL